MKNRILNALLCTLVLLCAIVYAQDTSPCAQCRFIGNDQVLVSCSQYWREIVDRCSSTPECNSYSIGSDLIDSCTNTPLPLPPGTGTSTITAIFESSTTAPAATTTRAATASASGSRSGSRSRSTSSTASASSPSPSTTPSQAISSASGRTSTTTNTPSGATESPTTTTRASASTTTTAPAGTFSQGVSVAAVNVPGWWVEGVILVAGWALTL